MSYTYSPYGLPYPPMPTDQYGGASSGVDMSPPAVQYPPMPGVYAPQAMPPQAMPPQAMPPVAAAPRPVGPPVAQPPGFVGPPTAAPPGGTGVTPRPALGPPIAAYGQPGGSGQPAGYGPGGPADPSVFVHPGQGNRNQFGSGLAATSPGPNVSDGGGGPSRLGAPLLPAAPPPRFLGPPVKQPPGDMAPPAFLGPPTAGGGGGVPPRQIGPPVAQPPGTSFVGPPTAKPPASVPNGATPVVGG